MRTKTRLVPVKEYLALMLKIMAVGTVHKSHGETLIMITGDFELTQNINEVRYILFNGQNDSILMQVDSIGDAVVLISA